jgi:hypothetical protein
LNRHSPDEPGPAGRRQRPRFAPHSEREAWLYDNSGATPRLVGKKQDGEITLDEDALPAVVEAARKIQTE